MNSLMLQQQSLLDALFARPGNNQSTGALHHLHTQLEMHASRGLMAYQANGHALAERSLLAAYPVIAQLIGAESFNALARDLWHKHPPRCGDLAQWGDTLPGFLATSEQLGDVPYLADVARVEWALHRAASAPDDDADLPSFARLSSEDPAALTLRLAPGTVLLTSEWPVVSVVTAHTTAEPTLAEAGRRLSNGLGETAVVWRQGWRPCVATCPANALGMLQALLTGAALTAALGLAAADFDFSDWLTQAVHSGLVTGVIDATPPPPEDSP
ncbi:DNA-binding domain-containing protein [Hydrogenophaga sp.]|uniref:HvfC/BufC N-terminal domain-containing protein n=1 Tax=Hydrogenophaga sp. TaxID=1904254 RepID=UPI0027321DAD|nr:DNA-binding domain-containing protein [Hydrogenophaga sp.]MDP2075478.1 DNA-binding domain-containing protein [Hydrogenophaga sp.]MDP3109044.1 DNA-binding domain-containing protein [Hydrogenophaga sp.]